MTFRQRVQRAGRAIDPGWDERDVERVWQGLKNKSKRRRRALAAGTAALATAAIVVWALRVASHPDARLAEPSRPAPPSQRADVLRLADGSTAVPSAGQPASLTVVEDTPRRVIVALAKGGARFDVVPRAERVFSVRAGEVTVTVLGTSFSVERVADRVGVAVTRGTVRVDWGAGARLMVAGEDGWFPPLVVSPTAGAPEAEPAAEEARPARRDGTRSGAGAPKRTKSAPMAPASAGVESAGPAVGPAAEPPDRPAAASREPTDAASLMAAADRARLAGHFPEGAALLERLIREHPDDERAPLAAFSLGRILLGELGRPADAARAFARVRALAPGGPLANDALAREAEAWSRAGDPDRARACESEYRARAHTEGGSRP